MMSDWSRMARHGAAHAWGARHYRWYAAREYAGPITTIVAVLVALGAIAGAGWWLLQRVPAPVVLLGASLIALAAAGLRFVHLMTRSRGSGGSLSLVVPVLIAVACIIGAVRLS